MLYDTVVLKVERCFAHVLQSHAAVGSNPEVIEQKYVDFLLGPGGNFLGA